jgi:hypothetical protein
MGLCAEMWSVKHGRQPGCRSALCPDRLPAVQSLEMVADSAAGAGTDGMKANSPKNWPAILK